MANNAASSSLSEDNDDELDAEEVDVESIWNIGE